MNYLYSEKDYGKFFVQDDVHFSHVLSPLFASFQLPTQEEGTKIACDTLKMPLDRFVCRLYRGRFYQHNAPYDGDMEARIQEHAKVMEVRMPIMREYFQQKVDSVFLPYYEKIRALSDKEIHLSEALSLIEEMHNFYVKAWGIHFDIVFSRIEVGFMLENMYKELTGDSDGQHVYELLVGTMNKSLETDRAFWNFTENIGSDVRARNIVLHTDIEKIESALSLFQTGRGWVKDVHELLRIYGYRTSFSHEFVYETWVENSTYAWELVRTYLQKEYNFDKEFSELVSRREVAFSRFLEKVPNTPQRQKFLEIYQTCLNCWGIDEDHHFYIDAMLPAIYRPVLLQIGRALVLNGVIDKPDDIFFLYYEDVIDVLRLPKNMMNVVHIRRREYEEYQREEGVPHLGPVPEPEENEDLLVDRIFGLPKFLKENTKTFVKGYAASRGAHTGTVKIVKQQDEFSKIKQGDVLVCKTTTPSWTVLFSVAGAIVTDTGGILSHAGTVAREYEIPAVVGTKVATKMLKDGDTVTVNGSEGTIVVVEK